MVAMLALLCLGSSTEVPAALVEMTGDLENYIGLEAPQRMGQLSSDYLVPNQNALTRALEMFRLMTDSDSTTVLARRVESIGYRLVSFEDPERGKFLILEEDQEHKPKVSWGTYVVNLNSTKSLMIEVTHPLSEVGSALIGVSMFTRMGARYLLMAGCRYSALQLSAAGGVSYYASDMEVAQNSLFHLAHKVWFNPEMTVIAVRGWWDRLIGAGDSAYHPDIILSNGAVIGEGAAAKLDPAYSGSIDFLRGLADGFNNLDPFFRQQGATRPNAGLFGAGISTQLSAAANIHAGHSRTTAGQDYHFIQLRLSSRLRAGVAQRNESGNAVNRLITALKLGLNDPPMAPQPRSPEDGSSFLPPYRIVLSLLNARDPDLNQPLDYQFDVAADVDFERLLYHQAGVTQGEEGITYSVLELPDPRPGELYWRARAFDGISYGPYTVPSAFRLLPSSASHPLFGDTRSLIIGGCAIGLAFLSFILAIALLMSGRKSRSLREQLDIQKAINDNHTVRIGYLDENIARLQPKVEGEKGKGAESPGKKKKS